MSSNDVVDAFIKLWCESPKEILLLKEQGKSIQRIASLLNKSRQTCYTKLYSELQPLSEWFTLNERWIEENLLDGVFFDSKAADTIFNTYSDTYPIKANRIFYYLVTNYSHTNWNYYKTLGCICHSETDIEASIENIVNKYADLKGKNFTLKALEKEIEKKYPGFLKCTEGLPKFLKEKRFLIKGDYILSYQYSKENVIGQRLFLSKALEWFYPSETFDITDPGFMNEAKDLLEKHFGTPASAKSTLEDSLRYITVKDDTGLYHLSSLNLNSKAVLQAIFQFVQKMEVSYISYQALYQEYEQDLISAGISSPVALHDHLRINFPKEYKDSIVLKKEYVLKKEKNEDKGSVYSDIIGYISKANKPVNEEELFANFGTDMTTKFLQYYKMYSFGEDLFLGKDGFVYLPNIMLEQKDESRINHLLQIFTDNEYGTASIFTLYKLVSDYFPRMLTKYSITSPRFLFYIMRSQFHVYSYRYPYISKEPQGSTLTYKVVSDAVYKKMPTVFTMEELSEYLFDLFPWSEDPESSSLSYRTYTHIRTIMSKDGISFYKGRSSKHLYTTLSKLGVNKEIETEIIELAKEYIENNKIATYTLSSMCKKLPKINIPWEKALLKSILKHYFPTLNFTIKKQ